MGADRIPSDRRGNAIRIRDLDGNDEAFVIAADTETAIGLIARVARCERAIVERLTATERDRLLAELYRRTYGATIRNTLVCRSCAQPFDIDFGIDGLVTALAPAPDEIAQTEPDGTYRMPDGVRFRIPSGADELAAGALPLEQAEALLMSRCVVEAPGPVDAAAVQDAMERIAPILDLDLAGRCPECDAEQTVRFDLQSYLLQSLMQERHALWRETHRLATTYHWSLAEILALTRADRQLLHSIIDAEAPPRARI